MVDVSQGEIWWVDLPAVGSAPDFRRPVLIVQGNASQIIAVDRAVLAERVARLAPKHFAQVMSGIDVVLGR